VVVNAGQVQSVVGQELSWWKPIWTSNNNINGPYSSLQAAESNWSFLNIDDGTPRLGLLNTQTLDLRILHAGQVNVSTLSKAAKYAAWSINGSVFVYEVGTGVVSYFSALPSVQSLVFSSDESVLFVVRGGPTLTRIPLANPNTQVTFPTTGNATEVLSQSADRWFVRETTDVRLVTPTTDVAQVFTQVSSLSVNPTAWALTNCTVGPPSTCALKLLSPTSTTAVTDSAVNPTPGTITAFINSTRGSRADYPCYSISSTSAFCVRSSDGTHYPLVAMPNTFRLNEAGDRVIFTYTSGANSIVREEAMPPQMSTLNLGSNTVGWQTGWLSPTRAYAFENSGSPRILHTIKAGTVTTDNDVGSQSIALSPPLIVLPQASTSKWRAIVGDGPVRALDVATSLPVQGIGARPLGTGPVTKFAAVSFEATSTLILDENAMTTKLVNVGSVLGGALRSGPNEFVYFNRVGGLFFFYVFNTGAILEGFEPGTSITSFSGYYAGTVLALANSGGRTVVVGSFAP